MSVQALPSTPSPLQPLSTSTVTRSDISTTSLSNGSSFVSAPYHYRMYFFN